MIRLCEFNELEILRETKFGVYLGDIGAASDDEAAVLLPRKEVPEGSKAGDILKVFIYLDSEDRKIATLEKPLIEKGQIAMLEVSQVTKIGAFLKWGLSKELLLPFKEQIKPVIYGKERGVQAGDFIPVILYIDKSNRPAVTMRIYNRLVEGGNYVKDSGVSARVIEINPDMGLFVAVDDKYFGMVPIREVHNQVKLGDIIHGRVAQVREDGKYMISLSQKAHIQMYSDADIVYKELQESGGLLEYGDKSEAKAIEARFHMSKNAFKRAIGKLYKEGKITLEARQIKLI